MVPKNNLDTTQTTLSENNNYQRGNISENKNKKIILENISFHGYFTEVNFDTPEGNQLSQFKNGYFFKKFW